MKEVKLKKGDTCSKPRRFTYYGGGKTCGRRATDLVPGEGPRCGLHARAWKWRKKRHEENDRIAVNDKIVEREGKKLLRTLGIRGSVEWVQSGPRAYRVRAVTVDFEELQKLIKRFLVIGWFFVGVWADRPLVLGPYEDHALCAVKEAEFLLRGAMSSKPTVAAIIIDCFERKD